MRECLVFEVTDRELDDGVLAVLCLDLFERVGAVGQERMMAQWAELGLRASRRVRRTISVGGVHRLRDLRSILGVVGEGLQSARESRDRA